MASSSCLTKSEGIVALQQPIERMPSPRAALSTLSHTRPPPSLSLRVVLRSLLQFHSLAVAVLPVWVGNGEKTADTPAFPGRYLCVRERRKGADRARFT
jgi:hypothetical protein